jgi:uncharacterized membrane protein
VKKRILIPLLMLGLLVALAVWACIRGTWADTVAHDPQTTAQGPVTQLFRTPTGDVVVRCAILIDAPASQVWDVVRDYKEHPRFLPYVSAMEVEPEKDGRVYLKGTAHSRLWGDWPFDVHVNHKEVAEGNYRASWDEPSDTMSVNRGSWEVTARGADQTLVVYTLQAEAAGYPSFFVRNLLLGRLPLVLRGLRDEVDRRQAGS